jgi:hypothetical protein
VGVQRKTFGRWGAAAGLGLAVLALQLLAASPASATTIPPGTVKAVAGQSATNTQASKSASAVCPAGQRVLGGGAFTVGGVHAVITELQPIHTTSGDRFEVTAAADQFGIIGSWGFQVFAFCAPVPATAGLTIVPHTNLPTSAPTDQARAECPAGTGLVSAGGKIDNGNGQVDLGTFTNSSGPFATASAAFAKEDADGFSGTYTVTGYSVCARAAVFGDIQQFKKTSAAPDHRDAASCPSGLRLVGLGGGTTVPGTHWQRLTPNTTVGGSFGSQSSIGLAGTWSMESTVFCAR